MHIGLIGGIGPAATEFYYRHITAAHARAKRPLDLTIVHADAQDLVTISAPTGAMPRQWCSRS